MRREGVILLAVSILGALLVSCGKEDSVNGGGLQEATSVAKTTFASQFPTASNVSWNKVQSFDVATFSMTSTTKSTTSNGHKCSAWYNGSGRWEMTEVEYTFEQLSDTVKSGFTASAYGDGSWAIVRIVQLKKKDGPEFFKFEVKKDGEVNRYLYFSASGKLLKVKKVPGECEGSEDHPTVVPAEIQAFITANYPTATLQEVVYNHNGYLVEIKDGAATRNLFFNEKFELTMTFSNVEFASLPQAVRDGLAASSYGTWTVKESYQLQLKGMPALYVVEVVLEKQKMSVVFDGTGFLITAQKSYCF